MKLRLLTADVYSEGESEALLGKAIAGRRHGLVLATKVRGRMGVGPNQVGLTRLHIIDAVENSLRRLGTDYIDPYQIHRFDALTNVEDTMRTLDGVVRAGKVRYIGCSNLHVAGDVTAIPRSVGSRQTRPRNE